MRRGEEERGYKGGGEMRDKRQEAEDWRRRRGFRERGTGVVETGDGTKFMNSKYMFQLCIFYFLL